MRATLEALIGPVEYLSPVARGYTHNKRVVATLRDGHSVFAKQAVDEVTAVWLRREHQMYEALRGRSLVPDLLGWSDGELPILILEDLSGANWPPPWDRMQIDSVLSLLAEVADVQPPNGLPILVDGEQPDEGWNLVLADPGEFLSLGLCDAGWLERAGPDLRAASAVAPLAGNSLLHCDVRSDNLCIRCDSAVLFDWNLASIGNPDFDIAFWLPSLAAENGPSPEDVMPDCPAELVAYVAGFFASRAGQPVIPHAPLVRQAQLQQLRSALPWAARSLDLHPP
jgi:hypothetical protein